MKKEEVVIKGTREGIIIILDDQIELTELKRQLKEKLATADSFLFGAQIVLDLGRRQLEDKDIIELERMITHQQGMTLKRISYHLGLGQKEETSRVLQEEITVKKNNPQENEVQKNQDKFNYLAKQIYKREEAASTEVRTPKIHQNDDEQALFVKKTIRSGQIIHNDGHILIMGDVNPGAEIVASGDIIVMGSLRGVAHAGATGNEDAIVMAFRLQPTQLRIANHITRPPDEEVIGPSYPEIARIKDKAIIIEVYQANNDRQTRIS